MRTGNILFSAVHFFVVFLVLGVGVLFLALPHADYFLMQLINFLEYPRSICTLIGGVILGIGVILFVVAYLLNRRQYVSLEMEGASVDIEEGVIRSCAKAYFQERFPDFESVSDVAIRGKSTIEIMTSLPSPQKKEFFEEVEEELGFILARHLGYQKPFTVTFVEN
jgi:hypothetical protein